MAEEIKIIDKPTYVTSARKEISQVKEFMKNVHPLFVEHFQPAEDGFHGSKTLWESVKGFEAYWESLEAFLSKMKSHLPSC